MQNVADIIEKFIISELFEEQKDAVNVQRSELAQQLSCAPSQITYTLTTRFTPERGYEVISKRGSGGFIRIVRLQEQKPEQLSLPLGMSAEQMVDTLQHNKLLSKREARLFHYNLKLLGEQALPEEKSAYVRKAYEHMSEDD